MESPDYKGAVLVTGFMPFGGEEMNPTELLLKSLPDAISGYAVKKLLLPVEFGRAAQLACAEYDRLSPAAVIMLGQAGGRSAITPETTAKNVMDASIPDNAGFMPKALPIIPGGAERLYSTFPAEAIRDAILTLGIPCELSDNAGAYVCNSLLYGMLAHSAGNVPAGFIHVPFMPEQGHPDKPSMELSSMLRGVTAAIEAVIDTL